MTKVISNSTPFNLVFGEIQLHTSFRIASASTLAGGPIEVEFCAELIKPDSVYLRLGADRMRGRASEFAFVATFAGVPLEDPSVDLPDMGGLTSTVEMFAGDLWSERIVLNEFVRLEETVGLLEPNASGELVVTCRRQVPVAAEQDAAFALAGGGPAVEGNLVVELRRDDAALAALVEQMLDKVLESPPEEREPRLRLLLALRTPTAVERWSTLVDHVDPFIADRARESLARVEILRN